MIPFFIQQPCSMNKCILYYYIYIIYLNIIIFATIIYTNIFLTSTTHIQIDTIYVYIYLLDRYIFNSHLPCINFQYVLTLGIRAECQKFRHPAPFPNSVCVKGLFVWQQKLSVGIDGGAVKNLTEKKRAWGKNVTKDRRNKLFSNQWFLR